MSIQTPILNPADPGLFRVQRGILGAHDRMVPDVGAGGRYVITTGEAVDVNGGTNALPANWRRVLDWHSPGFAVVLLVFLILLVHANINARGELKLGGGAGVRR